MHKKPKPVILDDKLTRSAMLMTSLAMGMQPGESLIFTGRGDRMAQVHPRPKRKPYVPAGCKAYWFRKDGSCSIEELPKEEVAFQCIALNEQNARRKFNRWLYDTSA